MKSKEQDDPVIEISDLLIHLSADQMTKSLAKGIEGEALDITLGSIPLNEDEKKNAKDNVLKILEVQYIQNQIQ